MATALAPSAVLLDRPGPPPVYGPKGLDPGRFWSQPSASGSVGPDPPDRRARGGSRMLPLCTLGTTLGKIPVARAGGQPPPWSTTDLRPPGPYDGPSVLKARGPSRSKAVGSLQGPRDENQPPYPLDSRFPCREGDEG